MMNKYLVRVFFLFIQITVLVQCMEKEKMHCTKISFNRAQCMNDIESILKERLKGEGIALSEKDFGALKMGFEMVLPTEGTKIEYELKDSPFSILLSHKNKNEIILKLK